MCAAYNAQPGRQSLVKPHHVNPYRGLWPTPEEYGDLDDFAGAFGFSRRDLAQSLE